MIGKDNVIKISDFKNHKSAKNYVDKEIFINLVHENKISLYRLAKGILKIEADVEDAISETVLKAFKNIKTLKDVKCFKPWIMRILVNECYALLNKKNKVELQNDMEVYNLQYEDKREKTLIWAVNKLEDDFKAVVILFYYEDMSIKDISKILNIPSGTVKSRLSRAKAKLKLILEDGKRGEIFG
ncbi:sigma-70 family RNA polymerase sigma factor [Clostridium sp. ATCC 25772]|uniref:sigma-70 family RNA polymerase sigma factor n=1 Tax=Clostridium sp. ATCC 25772 TaxID=1676991 RepID=UPI0007842E97|nr:sigma-70 family RNA polymerase sigma factor [Clostridium sp. ATCC 25772]